MSTLSCEKTRFFTSLVLIRAGDALLEGHLCVPTLAKGVVLFVHGSGSSREGPHDRRIAAALHRAGLGTLLIDLLTKQEMAYDLQTAQLCLDIGLLSGRIQQITDWIKRQPETRELPLGYLGTNTGTAAALAAAGEMPQFASAVVSRGGRPDYLAGKDLRRVHAPTLFIVGELDAPTLDANRQAITELQSDKELKIIPGASHLFEEPGAVEAVARLAREWFQMYLKP